MINLTNIIKEKPYLIFEEKYKSAVAANQRNIEAIAISSYDIIEKKVNSRFVNLKFVDNNNFIFFTNYTSKKANEFKGHSQISICIFWSSINIQIRIKANIRKTSIEYNKNYFQNRSLEKNALAISSDQSNSINSYSQVKENYDKSLKNDDLKKCPEFWGGYSFTPYYFEFWEGHESRINKREVFNKINGVWEESFLQP